MAIYGHIGYWGYMGIMGKKMESTIMGSTGLGVFIAPRFIGFTKFTRL